MSGTKKMVRRLEKRVNVRCHVLGELGANCYLVWSAATRQAVVIDPGGDASAILSEIKRLNLALAMIVNTHGHVDHIAGNGALAEATGAGIAIGAADAPMLGQAAANLSLWLGQPVLSPPPARLLEPGDCLSLGDCAFAVRAVPGHTPGGIALYGEGMVFTGDTLFAGGIGRTDLPGGDMAALLASIERELLTLPDTTLVYPGHGEATTIGRERSGNPFLGR